MRETYKVKGSCWLAGVHPSNQRIDRTVVAATPEAAAEEAFKAFHRDIWVRDDGGGKFTAMFGSRACGSVTVASKENEDGPFELVYSSGGTGGPYKTIEEAKDGAERRSSGEKWIAIVPADQINNLMKAKASWLLKGRKWEKGPRALPNVAPHDHHFAGAKTADLDRSVWERALKRDEADLRTIQQAIEDLRDGKKVQNLTLLGAMEVESGLEQTIKAKKKLLSKMAAVEFEDALIAERVATVYHNSPGALRKYLQEHPNADKSKHQVSTKHKPKARPQREREYEVGRAEGEVKKLKKNLDIDTEALSSAKDDKEREEIQRDIDRGKKQLEEAQSRVDKSTKDRDSNKRKPKEASAADEFEAALRSQRVAARAKQFIGEVGKDFYAIKIEGVDPDFLHQSFGQQTDAWHKIREWQKGAKKDWITAKPRKGQGLKTELKRWIQSQHPTEFYAKLNPDDDTHQIFYK